MSASTAKVTFASLLGMINVAANAVSNTIEVASDGVDMVSNTVRTMKEKQVAEHATDLELHVERYAAEATKTHTKFLEEVQEFRTKSPATTAAFDATLTRVNAAIAAARAQRQTA